ncbi:hypothetical protein ACFLRN_09020 [Thermoproteota archaeon]
MNEIIKTIVNTIILGISMVFFGLGVDHMLAGDLYNGTVISVIGVGVGTLALYLVEQKIVKMVMNQA